MLRSYEALSVNVREVYGSDGSQVVWITRTFLGIKVTTVARGNVSVCVPCKMRKRVMINIQLKNHLGMLTSALCIHISEDPSALHSSNGKIWK